MSHQPDSVSTRVLFYGFGAVGVLLVAGVVLPALLQRGLVERREKESPPPNPLTAEFGRTVPPAPRLQVVPARDLHSLREREDGVLETYGWVDRAQGKVRIPIERAMALLVEKGQSASATGGKARTP